MMTLMSKISKNNNLHLMMKICSFSPNDVRKVASTYASAPTRSIVRQESRLVDEKAYQKVRKIKLRMRAIEEDHGKLAKKKAHNYVLRKL